MAKKEVPIDHLSHYLPAGTSGIVMDYLHHYKVHLTITRERQSILGDYRHKTHSSHHRISINGNLNPYAFLVTLLHELAHLLTFEKYGNRVSAHGAEWKSLFSGLLKNIVEQKLLPADIELELLRTLLNPAASSCAEEGLIRVLRKYNPAKEGHCLLEELSVGAMFRIRDGRVFSKEAKLRKRYKCREQVTGTYYLFSPVYEVEIVKN
ncbi:MAG: SprT-like domain-containing protein [Chitinophagaceae bacterium]|jgi:SprT protein